MGALATRAQELDRAPDDRGHVARTVPEMRRARYQLQFDGRPGPGERLGEPDALGGGTMSSTAPCISRIGGALAPGPCKQQGSRRSATSCSVPSRSSRTPQTRVVTMRNTFRWVAACR